MPPGGVILPKLHTNKSPTNAFQGTASSASPASPCPAGDHQNIENEVSGFLVGGLIGGHDIPVLEKCYGHSTVLRYACIFLIVQL